MHLLGNHVLERSLICMLFAFLLTTLGFLFHLALLLLSLGLLFLGLPLNGLLTSALHFLETRGLLIGFFLLLQAVC